MTSVPDPNAEWWTTSEVAAFELVPDQQVVIETALDFHRRYLADQLDDEVWRPASVVMRKWHDVGRVSELLDPLLAHGSTAVRCTAADYLVRHAPTERAWQVLAALPGRRVREDCFFGVQASLLLREHGRLKPQ